MASPKKLPTSVKKARNTLNKSKQNYIEDEPKPDIFEFSPPPPDNLTDYGKKVWVEIVPQLVSLQIFSNIDKKAMFNYCMEQGLYEQACAELKDKGYVDYFGKNDYPMPSPWVAIRNKALVNATRISTEFGLTPSSRKIGRAHV